MHVVISLGGSLVYDENGLNKEFLATIKKVITERVGRGYQFGIVTGGGKKARDYASEVRKNGGNEFEADSAAIKATKENAKEVIKIIGKPAYQKVITDFDDAVKISKKAKVIVMGGTIPGITTDTDAALLAEALHAIRLINLSNVDAIYDSDPMQNPNAKKFNTLSYDGLITLAVEGDRRRAGTNFIFDILACKLIARSRIETHFVSGQNPLDINAAIEGKQHGGTVVK